MANIFFHWTQFGYYQLTLPCTIKKMFTKLILLSTLVACGLAQKKPVCTCPFGTPATGADCSKSTWKCADCNTNYVLTSENRCGKPIAAPAFCTCDFGTAATGTDCPRTMEKCASCQDNYALNTVNNRCGKECRTTKNIQEVCCNGKTYQNPSRARCGDDSKTPPLPICRGATKGSCETECLWPDHTQTTCDAQGGCSWVSAGNGDGRCDYGTLTNNWETCIKTAKDNFVRGKVFDALKTELGACKPPITTMDRVQHIRREAAYRSTVSTLDRNTMLNIIGAATTDQQTKTNQAEGLMRLSLKKMSEHCISCMTDGTAQSTCKTQAIQTFKDTFGTSARDLPSDDTIRMYITTRLPNIASQITLENIDACKGEINVANVRSCKSRARDNGKRGMCETLSAFTGTQGQAADQDLADQTLEGDCDASTRALYQACFNKRLADYNNINSGGDTTTDIDANALKVHLQKTAAKKATLYMKTCTETNIDFGLTATVVAAAKDECVIGARNKFKEFYLPPVPAGGGEALSTNKMINILQEQSMKEGSKIFEACAKETCTTVTTAGVAQDQKQVTCTEPQKNSCYRKAMVVAAAGVGKKKDAFREDPSDTNSAVSRGFKTAMSQSAADAAAGKKKLCEKAKESEPSLDCLKVYQEKFNAATGSALDTVTAKDMDIAAGKKNTEDAFTALTAFHDRTDVQKAACTKTDKECFADLLSGITGEQLPPTKVELLKQKAGRQSAVAGRKMCIAQKLSRDDCDDFLKQQYNIVHGENPDPLTLKIEKQKADDEILREYSQDVNQDPTLTLEDKQAKNLEKLKSRNPNAKMYDLKAKQKKNARNKVAELLNTKGATTNEAIGKVIKKQTGKTASAEDIKTFKEEAVATNVADLFGASKSAGLQKDELDAKINELIVENLDYTGNKVAAPEEVEKYKKDAIRKYAKDTAEAPIDLTGTPAAIQQERESKRQKIQETMESASGKTIKLWAAETELEEAAIANTLIKAGEMGSVKDDDRIREIYQEATGDTKIKVHQIKSKLNKAAAKSPKARNIMKSAGTTQDKRERFANAIQEKTGKLPDEVDTTLLVEDGAKDNMFDIVQRRSKARGGKAAGSAGTEADKRAENEEEDAAKQAAFEDGMGRPPFSKAEVNNLFDKSMESHIGKSYDACKTMAKTAKVCRQEVTDNFQTMDSTITEEKVSLLVKKNKENEVVSDMYECADDVTKTNVDCRKFAQDQLDVANGKPAGSTKPYEADAVIQTGATRQLGTQLTECDGNLDCIKMARQNYKKKTLDAKMTDNQFQEKVRDAASQQGLELATKCQPKEEDCNKVVVEVYEKASGKTGTKTSVALTAVKESLPGDIATSFKMCKKNKKECLALMRTKIKEAKVWDKRKQGDGSVDADDEEDANVEIFDNIRRGAIHSAKKIFRSCVRIIQSSKEGAIDRTSDEYKKCREAFRTELKRLHLKPTGATESDEEDAEEAEHDAKVYVCGTTMSALTDRINKTKVGYKPKTPKEVRELLIPEMELSAPMKDGETGYKTKPMEVDKLIKEYAMQKTMDIAQTCMELNNEALCKLSKDGQRSFSDKDDRSKTSLGSVMYESNGKKLQGKSPTKSDEEKITRKLGRKTIKHAIRKCMKANVALGKNRTKCIKRLGKALSNFVRGDNKNEAPDTSNAELQDAREFMVRCIKKKILTKNSKLDCKKEFIKRLKQTRQCDLKTGPPSSRSCPVARCGPQPKGCKLADLFEMTASGHCCARQCYYEDAKGKPCAQEKAEEEKEKKEKEEKEKEEKDSTKPAELKHTPEETAIEHAAFGFAGELSDTYENMGDLTKKEKLDTRKSMKEDLEDSGIEKRKVPLFLSTGAKLNAIYKTVDAKKAGLDDKAVEEVTKNAMDKNEDCDDYNDKTKKEIKTAVEAVVEGGLKADLKLKATKTVTLKVCQEEKEVTLKAVKAMVTNDKEAKKVTDEASVEIIKTPKQDPVSKETCAACSFTPKKGNTAAEVNAAFDTLEAKARRALRMMLGRTLANSGAAASSGETNVIVPGDDNSVAKNPAADYTMLIIGLVIGCLCAIALVVVLVLVVKKKNKQQNGSAKDPTVAYKPHAQQQTIEMNSNPMKR